MISKGQVVGCKRKKVDEMIPSIFVFEVRGMDEIATIMMGNS